ncbi:unnamed protein product, partial [Durusdinium trenchii]
DADVRKLFELIAHLRAQKGFPNHLVAHGPRDPEGDEASDQDTSDGDGEESLEESPSRGVGEGGEEEGCPADKKEVVDTETGVPERVEERPPMDVEIIDI